MRSRTSVHRHIAACLLSILLALPTGFPGAFATETMPEIVIIDDGGGGGDTGGGDNGGNGGGASLQKLPIGQTDIVPPVAGMIEAAPINGAYAFSIPVQIPPGINGFKPEVSLQYSSEGPQDSIVGAGFSLSAEQCIERRGPAVNTELQGLIFPKGVPAYNDADTFYLNGERLVLCDDQVGGPTDSCPAGTYRKRNNDFVKIVKVPAEKKFVAYLTDGSVAEYAAATKAWSWYHPTPDTFDYHARFCLSRVTKDGHSINYGYQDEYLRGYVYWKTLLVIDYGGTVPGTHYWRIRFNYENRPAEDVREHYDSGGYVLKAKRLKSIEVLTLPALTRIRKLVLTHDISPDTKRSRVTGVQEFGASDVDSMPPYVLSYPPAATGWTGPEWETGTHGLNANNAFTQFDANLYYGGDDRRGGQWPLGTSIADFNRDGLPDFVRHDSLLSSKVYLNDPNAPGNWVEDATWSARFSTIPFFFAGTRQSMIDQGVRLADLNGDGYVDVTHAWHSPTPRTQPNVYNVWLYDPTMNSGAGGFNPALGAGFRQALADNRITFNFLASWPSLSRAGTTQLNGGTVLSDLNGDGLPDILISREATGWPTYAEGDPQRDHWKTREEVWLNNGTTFVRAPAGYFEIPFDYFEYGDTAYLGRNSELTWPRDMGVRLGDFNGDGLPDLVQLHYDFNHEAPPNGPERYLVFLWLNNGKGWEQNWLRERALKIEANRHERFWFSLVERVSGNGPNYTTYNVGVELVDINSDGIDDFAQRVCYDGAPPVVPADCNNHWRTLITEHRMDPQYNEPTHGWRLASEWLLPYYTIRFRSASEDENLVDLENGIRFIDFNRDGVIDLFANKVYNNVQYGLIKPSRVRFDRDKITGLTNPYGGRMTVVYALSDGPGKASAQTSNPALPIPKIVMASLDYWNGRSGGDLLGEVGRTRQFHYFGGRFDPIEREFAGFRAVTVAETTAGATSYSTTWYGNRATDRCHLRSEDYVVTSEQMCAPGSSNCFIGSAGQTFAPQLTQTAIQTQRILKVTQNTYPGCPSSNVRGPFFAPVNTTIQTEYDPTQPSLALSSKQRFVYDTFGNRVNTLDYLKPSDLWWFRASWAYFFYPTEETPWMPGRICQRGMIARNGNANRAVFGEYVYYDGDENLLCNITSQGWPTKIEKKSYDADTGSPDFSVTERFTYTPRGNVATRTDGRGKVWSTEWNSSLPEMLPARTYDAMNRQTSYTYDVYGNKLTTLNFNGVRNETRYDGLHRTLQSWDEAAGAGQVNRRSWSYYLTGDPRTQTVSSSLSFDTGIFLQELDYVDGFGKPYLEVHYGNMEYFLISNLFDGLGRQRIRTEAWMPSNGFVFDIERPRVEHRYDALGREVETIIPGGYRRTRSYSVRQDEQSRLQRLETLNVIGPGGFRREKFLMQDSWNRPVAVGECSLSDCASPAAGTPGVHLTTYAYNSLDKLTDIVMSDGTSKVKNFYNGFGWLIAAKDPDASNCADPSVDNKQSGCPRRYSYDENGNLIRETDPKYAINENAGTAIGFFYDDVNRRTTKMTAVGWEYFVTYTYTYDQDRCGTAGAFQGQLAEERFDGYFENSSKSYCYDRFGRIASTATNFNTMSLSTGSPQVVQYARTGSGDIKRVTLPDGEILTYGFDDFGRAKSLTSSVIGAVVPLLSYNLHGQPDQIDYGNGYVADFSYRLGDYRTPSGDMRLDQVYLGVWIDGYLYGVNQFQYAYDPAGNVTMIYDADFSWPDYPDSHEYGYDYLDRLTSYWLDWEQKQTFAYDSLGNFRQRRTFPAAGSHLSYGTAYGGVAGPHAMVCEGPNQANPCTGATKTYAYDENGNLKSFRDMTFPGPTIYSYDLEGRLKAVVPYSGGSSVSYFYGPNGEMIADENELEGTIYIDPLYELKGDVPSRNYRLGGKVVARREGAQPPVYIITDHLGSVSMVTDTAGQTISQRYYYPFGGLLLSGGAYQTRLGFNGKRIDSEGTYYYGARHYSPDIGHFLQPDSVIPDVTDPQSLNRYAYTLNNPVKFTDPDGKCSAPSGLEPGKVGICIGSFIASKWLPGTPGLGDNRGPVGDDPKASFKSQVQLVVDPKTGIINMTSEAGLSSVGFSWLALRGTESTRISQYQQDEEGNISFVVTTTATNGWRDLGGPKESIDVSIGFLVTRDGKIYLLGYKRDGYPSLEIYTYDENGNPTLIHFREETVKEDLADPPEQEYQEEERTHRGAPLPRPD